MSENPFTDHNAKSVVYIREVSGADLPEELQGSDATVYAVHDTDGNRLGLAPDRRIAFALARRNDMRPLSVH